MFGSSFRYADIFHSEGVPASVYSYDLAERMQVHVFQGGHECKVWLDGLTIAFNRGFNSREIVEIRRLITERRAEIVERWLEHKRDAR